MVVIAILPAVSWLDGSGQLAWTMFSRTGRYRLVLTADGAPINPTQVAAVAAPGPTSIALAGSDHLRHHDVGRATMRRHLTEVARLACRLRPGARLTARLEEVVRSTDAVRATEVVVRCAP